MYYFRNKNWKLLLENFFENLIMEIVHGSRNGRWIRSRNFWRSNSLCCGFHVICWGISDRWWMKFVVLKFRFALEFEVFSGIFFVFNKYLNAWPRQSFIPFDLNTSNNSSHLDSCFFFVIANSFCIHCIQSLICSLKNFNLFDSWILWWCSQY